MALHAVRSMGTCAKVADWDIALALSQHSCLIAQCVLACLALEFPWRLSNAALGSRTSPVASVGRTRHICCLARMAGRPRLQVVHRWGSGPACWKRRRGNLVAPPRRGSWPLIPCSGELGLAALLQLLIGDWTDTPALPSHAQRSPSRIVLISWWLADDRLLLLLGPALLAPCVSGWALSSLLGLQFGLLLVMMLSGLLCMMLPRLTLLVLCEVCSRLATPGPHTLSASRQKAPREEARSRSPLRRSTEQLPPMPWVALSKQVGLASAVVVSNKNRLWHPGWQAPISTLVRVYNTGGKSPGGGRSPV